LFYKSQRINEIINKIKKITKITFAIQAAVPAMVPNPKTAAMIAMIKKKSTHPSMLLPSLPSFRLCYEAIER